MLQFIRIHYIVLLDSLIGLFFRIPRPVTFKEIILLSQTFDHEHSSDSFEMCSQNSPMTAAPRLTFSVYTCASGILGFEIYFAFHFENAYILYAAKVMGLK